MLIFFLKAICETEQMASCSWGSPLTSAMAAEGLEENAKAAVSLKDMTQANYLLTSEQLAAFLRPRFLLFCLELPVQRKAEGVPSSLASNSLIIL